MSAGIYTRVAMGRWLSRQLWWLSLLVVACCFIGYYDARWAVAGVILLLLGMMMLMTIVFFDYILSPHARWSVMEKQITINEQGIHFEFAHPRMNDHAIAWDDVKSIDIASDYIIINLMSTMSFIMLPTLEPAITRELKVLFLKSVR